MDQGIAISLQRHRAIMVVVSLLAVAMAVALPTPSIGLQLVVLAAAVAVFGIPHGALDHHAGRRLLRPVLGRRWWVAFFSLYIFAILIVIGGWMIEPRAMLAAFLAMSVLHFAADDPNWQRATSRPLDLTERLAVGSLPIVVPSVAHPEQVTTVFNWLLPAAAALDSQTVWRIAAAISLLVAPVGAARALRLLRNGTGESIGSALELFAIAGLFVAAPPLAAFAIYFCGWHSTRHNIELYYQLESATAQRTLLGFIRAAAPLTVVTAVAAALAATHLLASGFTVNESVGRVVFIGLSALTLPHMLLLAAGSVAPRQARRRDSALRALGLRRSTQASSS
jgi:Brp/Blh family beta-carotene 15,15'-monooxygenase